MATHTIVAQDWDKFPFKGKVLKATIMNDGKEEGVITFSPSGTLQHLCVETATGCANFSTLTATSDGYTGQMLEYKATATVKKGKLSTIAFSTNNYSYVGSSTYGANGFLEKTTMTLKWTTTSQEYVEATANIDTNGAQEILAKLRRETDPAKKAQLQRQYQAAVSGAHVNNSGGYTRERKENHQRDFSRTYFNYTYDEHGNWVSRSYEYSWDGKVHQQTQDIVYEPEYLSNFTWNKLQQNGDLAAIAAFAQDASTTQTYRQLASEYWNDRILGTIATGKNRYDAGDLDLLCAAAFNPLATTYTQDRALDIVRTTLWNEQVVPETDYVKVAEVAKRKWADYDIFDDEYKSRIMARSDELRTQLLADLHQQTQAAFDGGNYADAVSLAKKTLAVDAQDAYATDIKQEAAHRMILAKEQARTITEKDYADFIDDNPTSKYVDEVKNNRALLASSLLKHKHDRTRVSNLDIPDPNVRRIVMRRCEHDEFVCWRGKFFRWGFGLDGSMGVGHTQFGGSLNMRFGYFCSWVNLEVGAKYNYFTSTKGLTGRDSDRDGGYFEKHYLSVPVDLHVHLTHDWDYAWYLGLGAELGVANIRTNYVDKSLANTGDKTTKDNDLANTNVHISPKLAIGYTTKAVEVELFAIYDMDNPFNEDYAKANYSTIADTDIFKQQISDKFFDKTRFGLALRFLF